jgi:formate dehydrogenase beta subunit
VGAKAPLLAGRAIPGPLPDPAPFPIMQSTPPRGLSSSRQMPEPTDVSNPRYYHKVVDCQFACPAHTNVPEYIRLIAQGRFTESYLINRQSNVFPGILGRTCDRPCEPACRRGRVDGKPVAICRLKRVAADLRDDVTDLLPKAPQVKNGKRVALIGSGPSSLTVANDLMTLGYQCVIYEKLAEPGGLMRINIPSFRLPATVLDDEVNYILDMGVDIRYNSPVTSMKALLAEGYDAIFVGSGAPTGKDLDIPGRTQRKRACTSSRTMLRRRSSPPTESSSPWSSSGYGGPRSMGSRRAR